MNRPLQLQALRDRLAWDAEFTGPVSETEGAPVVCQQSHPARITLLGSAGGPSAISWRVLAVVIDAIQGVIDRWQRADIAKEGGEVPAPSVAHRNPAPAVVLKLSVPRVVTPSFRRDPRSIFTRERESVCAGAPSRADRLESTPARLRVAREQVRLAENPFCPTGASAHPSPYPAVRAGRSTTHAVEQAQHGEGVDCLSSQWRDVIGRLGWVSHLRRIAQRQPSGLSLSPVFWGAIS